MPPPRRCIGATAIVADNPPQADRPGERAATDPVEHPMAMDDGFESIERQIADGQYFLAYDTYRQAAAEGHGGLRLTLLGALALLRCGAVDEARRMLAPLGPRLESRVLRDLRLRQAFREAVKASATAEASDDGPMADGADAAFFRLLSRYQQAAPDEDGADDLPVLRLVGHVHEEIWARRGDPADLRQALVIAQQVHLQQPTVEHGLDAARLAALHGDRIQAAARAAAMRDELDRRCAEDEARRAPAARRFQSAALRVERAALAADPSAVQAAVQALDAIRPRHLPTLVDLLRKLDLLAGAGLPVPASLREALRPPVLVVFAGQALDAPGATTPCFPPAMEAAVARGIAAELDALGAEVGFSSAGAGAELLFVEAMLDRGAEVHLFLPFSEDDFVRHRVAYAGGHWERRFRNACKLATSITFATEEAFLGHTALLRFNHHLIQGMARASAALHRTTPHLLVTWDYAAATGAGSAADFIDDWPEIATLRLIHLDELREGLAVAPGGVMAAASAPAPAPAPVPSPSADLPERLIRTMLVADIVGYSQLQEQDLPRLWRAFESVKPQLAATTSRLRLVESWGDAIYAVCDTSLDMAEHAFALIDAVATIDTADAGLSRGLQLRVGLHAGPVFEGRHPLTGRPIVYGSHVSRTARIEPVSLPGHVYASQQFVAMLLAEENALRHQAEMTGGTYRPRYVCEYLGMLSLAKNYGKQQVYHVRRVDPAAAAGP